MPQYLNPLPSILQLSLNAPLTIPPVSPFLLEVTVCFSSYTNRQSTLSWPAKVCVVCWRHRSWTPSTQEMWVSQGKLLRCWEPNKRLKILYDFWLFLLQASCTNLIFLNSSSKFPSLFSGEGKLTENNRAYILFSWNQGKNKCLHYYINFNTQNFKMMQWYCIMKIMKVKISKQHGFLDIDLDQFRFSKIIDTEYAYFCLELLEYTAFARPKVLVLGHCCIVFCTV